MEFRLEKLIPLPLLELQTSARVWEADIYSFNAAESYLVKAASGKGKTTLLSILYGLRQDYRGALLINGELASEFTSRNWSELRKHKLSYIFQGLELFDDLSAIENIQLKNRIANLKSIEEIRQMAARLGVDAFLNKKCGILSYGQKQRVAIIRALTQPFEFLLADECFSHIDEDNSHIALELINEECDSRQAGIIMTSLGSHLPDFDHEINL